MPSLHQKLVTKSPESGRLREALGDHRTCGSFELVVAAPADAKRVTRLDPGAGGQSSGKQRHSHR